jgi:hypothetical protein
MFGHYKNTILENLEYFYENDEKKFNSLLNNYKNILEQNETLQEFDNVYSLIEEMSFDDEEYAKMYLDECINYLNGLKKSSVKPLKTLSEQKAIYKPTKKDAIKEDLDNLVFSNNIEKRTNSKIRLLNKLMESKTSLNEEEDPEVDNLLEHKIKSNYGQLNENETELVKAFLKENIGKARENFQYLASDTINQLQEKKKEYSDTEKLKVIDKSIEKLHEIQNKNPTEQDIENLLTIRK